MQIVTPNLSVHSYGLVDSGASALGFIDAHYAHIHRLPLTPLERPREITVVDGRTIESGKITHVAHVVLKIEGHRETVPLFVTKLGHYPVVLGIKWLQLHDVTTRWGANLAFFNSNYCKKSCLSEKNSAIVPGIIEVPDTIDYKTATSCTETVGTDTRPLNISMVGAAPFNLLSKRKNHEVFAVSLRDIDKALEVKPEVDPATILPPEYHEFLDVFSKRESDTLPAHRPYDCVIPLQPGKEPPFGPLRNMSQDELRVLKKYLEENLSKGFIRASSSPAAAPVLFVRKPQGGLRFCVDYRALNEMTVKNRYPLPLIRETLDRLSHARYFTKLDIIAAFNRLRMKEGEEWKTAFRTRYGLFEYLVMPFGLHGAPAFFQHYINDILREYLDIFCTAYIDDILIYSNTLGEHKGHVRKVLSALRSAGLQVEITKCEFHVEEVLYLGMIVGRYGIKMDPAKVAAIKEWATPINVKDVQSFLGFANFYRRFIRGFSEIAAPLTALTGKKTVWEWTPQCQLAFENLKVLFCTAPVLALYDPDLECVVETDASDHVSAGVFSQRGSDGLIRPIAFFSKKHSPAECNYEIYDKELLAVVLAFQEWRAELEGSPHPVKVLSDHRNLEYFMTTKQLNRRQARWAEYLSRFDFKIHYRPGKLGTKPDALTRRSGDLPSEGDPRLEFQKQVVLKPHQIHLDQSTLKLAPTRISEVEGNDNEDLNRTLDDIIAEKYPGDNFANEIIKLLTDGARHSKKITLSECEIRDGKLFYQKRMYVPNDDELRARVCEAHHDAPSAGHPGRTKTLELVRRSYFWPRMRTLIARYVRNCHTCSRSKSRRHAKYGVLKPLPVPNQRWKDISMDFVTGLPVSQGFDAILVVVDRLTKMRHMIATNTTATAEDVADLYVNNIYKLHGFPNTIVSDRGPQFAALFWKELCKRLQTARLLSTAFHPETDGQTEISNAGMEQYLRAYTTYLQDDWSKWLGLAEFSANNAISETTQCSPFFANYGYNPRIGFEPREPLAMSSLPAEIKADEYAKHMEDLCELLKVEMAAAQAKYEDDANRTRQPAPIFKVGDEVWLDAKNIRTKRPARKLDWKNLGRFKIKRVLNSWAYELELPETMKVHPVFHVSKLSLVTSHPLPGQVQQPAQPIEVDGEISWEVEDILDSRKVQGGYVQYLVKWMGEDVPLWEKGKNLDNCDQLLDTFHRLYPNKPRYRPRGARSSGRGE